jgi:hypothetical protein
LAYGPSALSLYSALPRASFAGSIKAHRRSPIKHFLLSITVLSYSPIDPLYTACCYPTYQDRTKLFFAQETTRVCFSTGPVPNTRVHTNQNSTISKSNLIKSTSAEHSVLFHIYPPDSQCLVHQHGFHCPPHGTPCAPSRRRHRVAA